ncbi:VOC family protein [Evansella clarkii]|uniref:VOC family protein n=1 Tax=Evansella clarkii TaxID=79879 RepID=UPI000995F2B7|nr:VOC family protein [Evansella clarkii]
MERHSAIRPNIGGVFAIVNQMPRAVKWYRDILGLPEDEEFMQTATPDMKTIYSIPLGGTNLILDSMHRDTLRPSTNHLFMIDTDDIEKTYEFLKQKKADIQSDIEGGEGVKFFEVLDSEGNKIMFCEEKE